MRSLLALTRKDLKGYFDQPTGYIIMVIFVGVISYLFFRNAFINDEASLRELFNILPWILMVFVPATTMRLVAEEQRDGTLEILFTQPIRGWTVLFAKFLAGLIFVSIGIVATVGIPIALESAGNLDTGAVVAQYLGGLLLAASFVAVGLFTSSMTQNQIVAFILGLFFIAVLMVVGLDLVADTMPEKTSSVLQTLSPATHFSSITRGVIDLRDILYFIALISTFLSATYLMIRSKSLSHQAPQYRNLQMGVAGLIVLSLLIGWFGGSIGGRLDLTEEKRFTLSAGTKEILSELDDFLTVKLFASHDPPPDIKLTTRDVNDFLDDFKAGSRGKVKLIRRFPDPGDEEEAREAGLADVQAKAFNVRGQSEIGVKFGYLGLTMTYADRRETIPFIPTIDGFEYRVATLANKMIQRDRQTVAFLTGHGEKTIDGNLQSLAGLLEEQYDVTEVEATDEAPLDLSGVDVLVIPGPTRKVSDSVRDALHAYLDGGGKAMVLIDPVQIGQRLVAVPNRDSFGEFVERYGVVVEDNLVFDVRSNETLPFPGQFGSVLIPYPYWAYVTTVDVNVTGAIESVLLPWASSLGITESEVGRVEVITLLRTQSTASVDYAYGDVGPNSPQLDVTDRQLFESDMAVAVAGPGVSGGDGSAGGNFRLVVVGDSEWITDGVVGRNTENLFLGLNLIDWLAQEDTLATIRSKVTSTRRLDFTSSSQQNLVQYSNIVGAPLVFVVIGMFRFVRRRATIRKVYGRER